MSSKMEEMRMVYPHKRIGTFDDKELCEREGLIA